MKFKETAFLALMAALSLDAAWFTRYASPTAVPRQGDFIHIDVDTAAGKRMDKSPWFTKTSVDSVNFDDFAAQADHSPGDTSWEVTAYSAESSPSVYADYFIRGASGRAANFGKGTMASLPLIMESKPLGYRDTTRNAWIHLVQAPFEPQLPGIHEKTATAYGSWIVSKDQKGTFYSTREGYGKVSFARYRVEMLIDSVLVWELNAGGTLVGKKVSAADQAYEYFRTRYAKQRLFYFNPGKGVFLQLSEFIDVDYLKWDVYFYFQDKETPASMGSIQAFPKAQIPGLSWHDALGRKLPTMNSFLQSGLLQ